MKNRNCKQRMNGHANYLMHCYPHFFFFPLRATWSFILQLSFSVGRYIFSLSPLLLCDRFIYLFSGQITFIVIFFSIVFCIFGFHFSLYLFMCVCVCAVHSMQNDVSVSDRYSHAESTISIIHVSALRHQCNNLIIQSKLSVLFAMQMKLSMNSPVSLFGVGGSISQIIAIIMIHTIV